MQHDQCYAQNGFSPTSNYTVPNSTLQGCNQALCNASQMVVDTTGGNLVVGPLLPAVPNFNFLLPTNQASKYRSALEVIAFFTHAVPSSVSCH